MHSIDANSTKSRMAVGILTAIRCLYTNTKARKAVGVWLSVASTIIQLVHPQKAKSIIFVPDVELSRNTLGVQRINFSPCLIFFA